jgi:xanthine dehydrogenase accessory factor
MRELIPVLERWTREGKTVAMASVTERVGSAPRDPGAALAVSSAGEVAGSVTGGCVEPALIREANEVLAGAPGRLCRYGVGDEDGFDVGLSCGGSIAVAVYRLDPQVLAELAAAVADDRPTALAVRLDEARFGEQSLLAEHSELRPDKAGLVATPHGLLYVEPFPSRPNLYAFGVSAHVAALVPVAKSLGYRVTVCDPRSTLLTRDRFPDADALVDEWPDRFLEHAPIDGRTAVCVMSHALKFDVPALAVALRSPAGYVGAMGSAKVRATRTSRLRELGLGDADLARLHAPIGLHLGGRTPEEVAISIAAELVEARAAADPRRPATSALVVKR